MKILIGYDGSDCADGALHDLRRAGLPLEAEALVISVAESWIAPRPSNFEMVDSVLAEDSAAKLEDVSERDAGVLANAQGLATEAAKRIQSSFPRWNVRSETKFGSPASELLEKADEWKPDLIVVGSHGRSAISRLILGSVSHKVVTEAQCAVRIARGHRNNGDSPVRIVIGVDGSTGAAEAAQAAAGRSWPAGSEVRLIAVVDTVTPTIVGNFIPPVVHWVEAENLATIECTRSMVESLEEQFRTAQLGVSHSVRPDDPRRALVREAEAWGADCIFVGARGLGPIDRFLLGSVSEAVAMNAQCSVEVIRSPKLPGH